MGATQWLMLEILTIEFDKKRGRNKDAIEDKRNRLREGAIAIAPCNSPLPLTTFFYFFLFFLSNG